MKVLLLAGALLLTASQALAMGEPDHSSVAVESKSAGDKLEFTFKVNPTKGLHINMEGPWKLEIKNADGLTFSKTTFGKSDMNEKIPGYSIATTAKPAKASGKVDYSLTAFVCTNDQTQCFREVHSGKADWTTAKK